MNSKTSGFYGSLIAKELETQLSVSQNPLAGAAISGHILSRRKLRQEDQQLTQIPMLAPLAELGTHNAPFIP